MDAVNYSNFRKNLKDYMIKVNEDAVPYIVTSKNAEEDIVVMSKRDYDNMVENAYINSSKANVDFIMASWKQARTGQANERPWQ
ncbi:MAG: type II toxin-antitoxin system prevent-host-death family antitoxin [Streptococcaceae bacterium]|jgi:antitoxin YefM|nr:type II toxin-antitoxin system prevent-host-death family antitoxin [Streptococcaceae bacterium]